MVEAAPGLEWQLVHVAVGVTCSDGVIPPAPWQAEHAVDGTLIPVCMVPYGTSPVAVKRCAVPPAPWHALVTQALSRDVPAPTVG